MPEERNKEKLPGDVKVTSPFLRKLENFWYHYKWPFLLGTFFLVVLIVCLSQCARNGRGNDAFVMFAGAPAPTPNQQRDIERLLEEYVDDRNGDEKIVIAVQNYAIYTEAEIKSLVSDAQAHAKQLTYDNRTRFAQDLEATLCFLSRELYDEEVKGGGLLPLSEVTAARPSAEGAVLSENGVAYGVLLKDLAIAENAVFRALDEDTVVCMRRRPFSAEEDLYEANKRVFARLLEETGAAQ